MKPLGSRATLGWVLVFLAIAQGVGAAVVIFWFSSMAPSSLAKIRYDGALVALVTLITNPIQIVLLAAVARWRTGGSAAEYLGLTRFSRHDFLLRFLASEGLTATLGGISYLAGVSNS